MFFHPIYSVVNAAVVGRMETHYLAALGLGSLTCGICLLSINACFSLVLTSFIAPAYGSNNLELGRLYLHRQYLLSLFVYLATLIPIAFLKQIYAAIGQEEEVSKLAIQYVWSVAPCVIFYVQSMN